MRRLRGPLVALVAALLELVIVAGVSNQWVTKRVEQYTTKSQVGDTITHSMTAFAWRFSSQGGNDALWVGQLIGAGTLIVLVFLFVLAPTAGASPSFIGTFVGVWGVTALASLLAAGVRQFIAFPDLFPDGRDAAGLGRWANALTAGPTSQAAIFGVISGFVVGLLTAIVAVASAKELVPAAAPAAPVTEEEPAWSPETAPPWGTEYGQPAEAGGRADYTAPLPDEPYDQAAWSPEFAQYPTERQSPVAHPDAPTVAEEPRTVQLPPAGASEAPTREVPPHEAPTTESEARRSER